MQSQTEWIIPLPCGSLLQFDIEKGTEIVDLPNLPSGNLT